MATEDDEYVVPLQDQRIFGAGIKRKGIAFVPATSLQATPPASGKPTSTAADRYMSIVLPQNERHQETRDLGIETQEETVHISSVNCAICNQHIASGDKVATDAHESSIAHQVCLEHSHPPSHLDRDRVGVKYLSDYGWDPDSRKGLGAREDGIRIPIKAKEKYDTVGLREQEENDSVSVTKKPARSRTEDKTVIRLNAKEVRRREIEMKKRTENLRASFYGSSDVEKYLGSEEFQPLDLSGLRRR